MRFGLVARADDRGLGNQTFEIARHLLPKRVLVVDMPDDQHRYTSMDAERYRRLGVSVTVVPMERMGEPEVVGPWLDGLDVVYSAETYYDWRFCDLARKAGARTVLHANPEFVRHGRELDLPGPDVWWTATPWLVDEGAHEHMPRVDRIMPMPVPIDRWPQPRVHDRDKTVSFLHVGGHMAMADRNGTRLVFEAMRKTREPMRVTVTTQRPQMHRPRVPRNVDYTVTLGNQPDYASLYRGHDVLLMPRRYGGLCLPTIEACGAGLAVVMSRQSPNNIWPVMLVDAAPHATVIDVPLGQIEARGCNVTQLAALMDELARDRDRLVMEQTLCRKWAEAHSWDAMRHQWLDALEAAASTPA